MHGFSVPENRASLTDSMHASPTDPTTHFQGAKIDTGANKHSIMSLA